MTALTTLLVITTMNAQPDAKIDDGIRWLTEATRRQLKGCRLKAHDGTVLYTPDGKGNYAALWTRDFAYMVENAGDLLPAEHTEACIRYLVRGIRADGAAPDRVQADGRAVYVAGPVGKPNLDNGPFLVIAVNAYLDRLPAEGAAKLFAEWAPSLVRAMDYLPLSPPGLIWNDPAEPHSPYGFTDCIGKTGELFKESLLYWRACRMLATWFQKTGQADQAVEFTRRSERIEKAVDALWNDEAGMFFAASQDCRQIDIWGNAYAISIGFPLGTKEDRIVRFLIDHIDRYVSRGQVRHLVSPETWQRLLTPVPKNRYQNGAYWATASGWVMIALHRRRPDLARRMVLDLIEDFHTTGICECVHGDYRKLPDYVNSATNPLAAARRLWGPRDTRP